MDKKRNGFVQTAEENVLNLEKLRDYEVLSGLFLCNLELIHLLYFVLTPCLKENK